MVPGFSHNPSDTCDMQGATQSCRPINALCEKLRAYIPVRTELHSRHVECFYVMRPRGRLPYHHKYIWALLVSSPMLGK